MCSRRSRTFILSSANKKAFLLDLLSFGFRRATEGEIRQKMNNMSAFVFFIATAVLLTALTEAAKWNYKPDGDYGPKYWPKHFPKYCSVSENIRQSPIDIKRGTLPYSNFPPLELDNYKGNSTAFKVHNNGHTLQADVLYGKMMASGGPFGSDSYKAVQFHLHWGNATHGGSEHTVLGKHFQAEMHIVHLNYKHLKLPVSEIVKKPNGLMVLAVFIEIADPSKGQSANYEFSKLMNIGKHVVNKSSSAKNASHEYIQPLNLLPADKLSYYTYPGGLTTPTCNGVVLWVLFKDPIYVSREDIKMLWDFKDDDDETLTENRRPTQPIGARVVRTSFRDSMTVGASSTATSLAAIIVCVLLSFLRF